ncbi:hypothetical protein KC799_20700, partial [candidate division KSB1 bacterium]|nr:hypothetical protein [candidate division KSB1 bacterium]
QRKQQLHSENTLSERLVVIAAIISQAELASNNFGFSPESENGKNKIATWNNLLSEIPLEWLLKLYNDTEREKSHAGMVTPRDMLQCWQNVTQRKAQREYESKQLPPPTAQEAKRTLDKIYLGIKFEEQRKIHRTIIQNYRNWAHNEHFADPSECACNFEKFPMYVYTNTKTGEHLCLWCLAEKLGLKQE